MLRKSDSIAMATSLWRRLMCSKQRKYPIDPEAAKQLPVFDYGKSKAKYKRVFVWGNVQTGATGYPYMKSRESINKREYLSCPKRLGFAEKFNVTSVACGFGFTAFAVDDKETEFKLYGTGLNTDSQIGYHAIRAGYPLEIIFFPQPIRLPFRNPEKAKVVKVKAGRAHLAVLTQDEGLFLLGNNSYGQCGRRIVEDEDYAMSNYINHRPKMDGKEIVDIECGQDHTFVITKDGAVYSCGWGADGQTGLGHYNNTSQFTRVCGDIEGEKIVKVASRSDFVLALNDKGQVFGWGNAEYSQIRTPNNVQQVSIPTYLNILQGLKNIKDVATGGSFCVVVDEEGQLYVWGYGILGVGPRVEQSFTPIPIPQTLFGRNDFQPDNKVVKVNCGLSHAMAITNLGDLYAWGRNSVHCLGLGDEKDQYFPLKVSMGGSVQEVSCGVDHTVAVCKPFI